MVAKKSRDTKSYIYGTHALTEALLHAPHTIKKVYLSPNGKDSEIRALLAKHQIPTDVLSPTRGNELVGRDTAHQGVIAVFNPSALLIPFDTFLSSLDLSTKPAIAILGELSDPHNVGAIIRSAAAFGLSAVLIPSHHQAPITGTVVKTSAGMAFTIPLVSIGNVNNTLSVLKEHGFWTYGLEMHGSTPLHDEAFGVPTAFVIGNEGRGIREKTLHACDVTLSIPMHARAESLNAAASAAVVFYAWAERHPGAVH